MQTYGSPVFAGLNYLTDSAPIIHMAPTTEIEYPWRVCPRSLVIRLPGRRGLVIGIWKKNNRPWYETVLEILRGREIGLEEEIKSIFSTREDME